MAGVCNNKPLYAHELRCILFFTAVIIFVMKNHYWESRLTVTPQKALEFLVEGNERFMNNLRVNRNLLQLVNETADRQFPFASILSCSDSRISTELIFDQGLGDIFSIRLAGNIASINAIGSMEYACKFLDSKLIVVMGHTNCGAVKAACDSVQMDNLNEIFGQIQPSIELETETLHDRTSNNKRFINNVTRLNVLHNINTILRRSSIITGMLKDGEIGLTGAMYDVETGRVEFIQYQNDKKMDHENYAYKI
jgi:carbonic anhydrase